MWLRSVTARRVKLFGLAILTGLALFGTVLVLEIGWYSPAAAVDALDALGSMAVSDAGNDASIIASPAHLLKKWHWNRYHASEGVVFLKTHKTASSSLAGVFWRNLCTSARRSCFLPPRESPGRTWDLSTQRDWYAVQTGASTQPKAKFPFDVWVSHVHFHPRLYAAVSNTNRIISIVRCPAERFASAWAWYEHEKELQTTLSEFVEEYVNDYSPRGLWYAWTRRPAFKYRTGLEASTEELLGEPGFTQKNPFIQRRHFDQLLERVVTGKLILMVTDRFDESLLVLGKLMGWGHEQLIYSRLKVTELREGISDDLQHKLNAIQPFDHALWKLANHMLDIHIKTEFPNLSEFHKKLSAFQQFNEQVSKECKLLLQEKKRVLSNSSTTIDEDSRNRCEALFRDNSDAIKFAWEELNVYISK